MLEREREREREARNEEKEEAERRRSRRRCVRVFICAASDAHAHARAWNARRRHNTDAGRRSSRSVRFLASVCRASWVPPCAPAMPLRVYEPFPFPRPSRSHSPGRSPARSLATERERERRFNYSPHRASNSSNRTLEASHPRGGSDANSVRSLSRAPFRGSLDYLSRRGG